MNYVEEQLQNAVDSEKRCYNKNCETRFNNMCANDNGLGVCNQQIKEPVNYEAENEKLKDDIEILKLNYDYKVQCNDNLTEEIDRYKNYIAELKHQSMEQTKVREQLDNLILERNSLNKWLDTAKESIKALEEENKTLRNAMKIVANLL